jgi:hypothetical protein
VRQSMILNHVNQVARAYSVGFFAEEAAAEQEIVQYSGYFVDEGRSLKHVGIWVGGCRRSSGICRKPFIFVVAKY